METIGGIAIETYRFTRALGVNPASASGVAIGDPGLGVGDYVVYQFGAIVFYGIVSSVKNRTSIGGGSKYHFEIVDNRIRLQWQIVKGMWNIEQTPAPGDGAWVDADSSQWSGVGTGGGSDDVDPAFGAPPLGSVPSVGEIDVPGLDPGRRRRYGHILPDQWAAQIMTYTDAPLTAAEVLSSAFNGADGGYGFGRTYHSAQTTNPVLNVDANNGMVLSNLVQEVSSRQGLSIDLIGSRGLRWWRKGEGSFTPPVSVPGEVATCPDSLGMEMSRVPTAIHVIGDRTLVQYNVVAMEPDWAPGWEEWISEVDFVRKVGELLELVTEDTADFSERAARAREITVSQFIALEGEEGGDYRDYGRWGELSRMDIPAWVYINEIVYRSYRIPRDFELYGVPLDSLKISPKLLAAVEKTGEGQASYIRYRRDPEELYPAAKAFCMAKGQPLDLVDERSVEAFVTGRTRDLRLEFSEVGDFEVDEESYSIRFKKPIFLDGDPAAGKSIFLYPNKGEGGYVDASADAAGTDLLHVVVPNPDYVISAAEVRMSFVFSMGKWEKLYGSGPRRGVHYAHDLALHVLDMTADGGFTGPEGSLAAAPALRVPEPPEGAKQILYRDGSTVEERSDAVADSQISQSASVLSGSYSRVGAAGQALSGIVDRVTISVTANGGITESIELTKERPTGTFLAEHEVVARQRTQEMFPGQWELQKEARQLRAIARLQRQTSSDTRDAGGHKRIFDLGARPIGDDSVSTVIIENDGEAISPNGESGKLWKAGHVIFMGANGRPSLTGKTFGGVLVKGQVAGTEGGAFTLPAVHRGVVPVIVQGPFLGGDVVGVEVEDEESFARAGGGYLYPGRQAIGLIEHHDGYSGEEKVVAMVRLVGGGGGGKSVEDYPPFAPIWSSEVDAEAAEGAGKIEVVLKPGWVIDILTEGASGGGATEASRTFYMPVVEAFEDEEMALNAEEWPTHELAGGETLYVAYETDVKGKVKSDEATKPRIITSAEDEFGVHYQPVNPGESGVEGVYRIPILEMVPMDDEDEDQRGKLIVYQNSDIEHYHELPTMVNVGNGASPFRKRDYPNDVYEWRSTRGNYGVVETQTAFEIQLDLWLESVGGGCAILVDPVNPGTDESAKFRRVTERAEYPQVRVHCKLPDLPAPQVLPSEVTIEGNGFDKVVSGGVKNLRVVDGLVTEFALDEEGGGASLPEGDRGDILYHDGQNWVKLVNPGNLISDTQWVLHHKGTVNDPHWVSYEELAVNICVAGVVTPYKILGIANPPPP